MNLEFEGDPLGDDEVERFEDLPGVAPDKDVLEWFTNWRVRVCALRAAAGGGGGAERKRLCLS